MCMCVYCFVYHRTTHAQAHMNVVRGAMPSFKSSTYYICYKGQARVQWFVHCKIYMCCNLNAIQMSTNCKHLKKKMLNT